MKINLNQIDKKSESMSAEQNIADCAKVGYEAYCKQAKYKTFDGRPIPKWEELGEDRQACFVAFTKAAIATGKSF